MCIKKIRKKKESKTGIDLYYAKVYIVKKRIFFIPVKCDVYTLEYTSNFFELVKNGKNNFGFLTESEALLITNTLIRRLKKTNDINKLKIWQK